MNGWIRALSALVVLAGWVLSGCGGGTSGGSTSSQPATNSNPIPAITSVSPSSVNTGSGTTIVTVAGTGFVSASTVQWNGTALTTTYTSATSLGATIPASDLATAATAQITVSSPAPGGGTSNAMAFTVSTPAPPPVTAPTITSLSPSSTIAGNGALTVSVSGTGFVSSSVVQWNGAALSTTYQSATSLQAAIAVSYLTLPGTVSLTVANPVSAGGTSNALPFTVNANPLPTLIAVSPSGGVTGAAITLSLAGTNFVGDSVVQWNGSALPTTVSSGTQLQTQIPASDLTTVGTARITVQTPAPGGGTSNAISFPITLPPPAAANLNVLNIQGNDLVWDQKQKKIYVSTPSNAGSNGNSVVVVDPVAGTGGSAQFAGSEPNLLAISDDSQFLYAGLNGSNSIQRFTLPNLTPDIHWTLGSNQSSGPYYPLDLQVAPGAPHTTVVSLGAGGTPAAIGGLVIYDDSTPRPTIANGFGPGGGDALYSSVQWGADSSSVYAENNESTGFDFYTLNVNSSGITLAKDYGGVFNANPFGGRIHFDAGTGLLYADSGQVINPSDGTLAGLFANYGLAAPDSTVGRVFILGAQSPPSGGPTEIDAFDQTHFTLLHSLTVPNVVGTPTHLIRWGNQGLAFLTSPPSGSTTPGQLYIVDGAFVNSNGAADTEAGSPLNATPTLVSISPVNATVGSTATALTLNGTGFAVNSTAEWNGEALTTTYVNSTEVKASIPASDLANAGVAAVTVANPAPGGGASNSLPFSIRTPAPAGVQIVELDLAGNDLAWNPQQQTIYVTVPSVDAAYGNSITEVNPATGAIVATQFAGSEPTKLAISGDSQFLYAGLYGTVQRFSLPTLTPDINWNLGSDSFFGPYFPLDLQVAPGAPGTVAVTGANYGPTPSARQGVVIYDNGVARPTIAGGYDYDSLQWGSDASTLYAANNENTGWDLFTFSVNASGVTQTQVYPNVFDGFRFNIHYDPGTGYIYADEGTIVNPATGTKVGSFGASGIAAPDSTLNEVFFVGQTPSQAGTQSYSIESFDQTKFTPIASITIPGVVGTPTALIRWGSSGLALVTNSSNTFGTQAGPGQLFLISGTFVNPTSSGSSAALQRPAENVKRTWKSPKKFVRPPRLQTPDTMH